MSQVIDTKVVEMQFDNSKFEKNIEVSLNSLKFLNKSIDDAGKNRGSLDELAEASDKVGLSIENVGSKSRIGINLLEMLSNAGVSAFNKISDAVAGFALNLANSLSGMQAMRDGFNEYELKMGSVQTILAGAKIFDDNGKSVEDEAKRLEIVNDQLEKLNAYSDKTIYSFKDMTSNIGKFTNAGVNLDDSVQAIQGVANVAAVSGANAQEASRAMYNFSQALSSGAVKLIDWKSIENANMATVEFKQQLLDTAVALGTVVKEGNLYQTTTTDAQGKVSDWFNSTTKFNDALSNQWMTTEVLTQTLKNYSTDVNEMTAEEVEAYKAKLKSIGYTDKQVDGIIKLSKKAFAAATEVKTFSQMIDTLKESLGSGWAQTFEIIFGDFKEAKALWTGLNNVIDGLLSPIAKTRNAILKLWKDDGGREAFFNSFRNLYQAVVNLLSPLKALWKAFTPNISTSSKVLITISKGLEKITTLVAKLAGIVGRVLSVVLRPVIFVGNKISKLLMTVFGIIQRAGVKVAGVLTSIGTSIKSFADSISKVFDKHVITRINAFRIALSSTFENIKKRVKDSKVVNDFIKAFRELRIILHDLFNRVVATAIVHASNFVSYLRKIWNSVSPLISAAFTSVLKTLANAIFPRLRKAINWAATELRIFGEYLQKIDIKNSRLYKGLASLPERLKVLTNNKSLKSIASTIKSFGSEALTFLINKFAALKKNLESITMPSGLANVFESIKNFIKSVFGKNSIDEVDEASNAIEKMEESFGETEKMTAFQKFLEGVSKAFDWLRSSAEKAVSAIKIFIDFVIKNTPKALKSLRDFIAGDDGVLSISDVKYALAEAASSLSLLLEALGMYDLGKAAGGVSEAFGDLTESISTLLKRTSNRMKMAALKDFAISIAIMAGALFLLAQVPWKKLVVAAGALFVITKALTYFFDYISTGSMKLKENAVSLLPLAALIISIGIGMVAMAASLGILVGALAVFPKVIKSYNNLGEEFRTGMDRVKEVLAEIFTYLDHTVNAKYGFRAAAALLALVTSLSMIRSTIVKFAGKETEEAMADGLERIGEVLDLLGEFLGSVSLSTFNFVNIGIDFDTLGIAAIIFALGSMINKITDPLLALSKLTPDEYKAAFDSLSSILLYLGVFLASVSAITALSGAGLGQLLGVAANITLVSYAIGAIVNSLSVMTGLVSQDAASFKTALLALGGIFVALGAVLIIIGKLKPEKGTAALFALALAVGALTACVVALVPLAMTDPYALMISVVALGSLMVALGIAFRLAGEAAGKASIKDILMLIAMTFSMLVLASAIRRLADSGDPMSLVGAAAALGIGVLALVAAMTALNAISVNPLFIAALALIAVTVWGIAAAIQAFKSSASGVADTSKEVEGAVKDSGQHLEAFAGEVIPGLIDKLFGELGPKIKEAIGNFDLASTLREQIEKLKASAKNWAQDFIDIGTNIIEGISTAIGNPANIERIKECMVQLGSALVTAFKSFLGISSPSTVMIEQGGYIIDGLLQGLMQFPSKLAGWVSSIGQFIVNAIAGLFTGILTKGQELIQTLAEGLQNGKSFVIEKASEIGTAILNKISKVKEWGSHALSAVKAFANKLKSGKSAVSKAVGSMITGAIGSVKGIASSFKKLATDAISKLASGFRSGQAAVKTAVRAVITGAKSPFTNIASSFKTFGINAAQGFRNGINSMVSKIADKARELVRAAKNAAKSEQHSQSPSKDFAKYGTWAAQGYALGLVDRKSSRLIESNARKMVDSAKNVATSASFGMGFLDLDSNPALSSLAYAMGQISDSFDNAIDSDLTIRPVVDLSDVNRSASAISTLFGDRRFGASVDYIDSVQSDFDRTMSNKVNPFSTKSIDKLSNRIADMADSANNRPIINNITVDGAENPEEFADRFVRRIGLKVRTT